MINERRLREMLRSLAQHLDAAAYELRMFAGEIVEPEPPKALTPKELSQDIGVLELSVRSDNCLRAVGVNTIGKLIEMTPETFFHIRSFGARSRDEVNEVLVSLGYEPKVRD